MDFTKEFEIYDLLVKNQTEEIKQEDEIDDDELLKWNENRLINMYQ